MSVNANKSQLSCICGVSLIIIISFLLCGQDQLKVIYISCRSNTTDESTGVILPEQTTKSINQTQKLRQELKSLLNYPINDALIERESTGVFVLDVGHYLRRSHSATITFKGCNKTRVPHIDEIQWSNDYWQVMRVPNATIYLYNAFADKRVQNYTKIRVIGITEIYTPRKDYKHWCHLWSGNGTLIDITNATAEHLFLYGNDGAFHPYLITCLLPKGTEWPESVSIITGQNKCQLATNQLKVVKKFEKVGDFGVCFKWLDFPDLDLSRRIVEMVELLRRLGVSGIHFPYMSAHPNVDKVLDYYQQERDQLVLVKPFSLPGPQLNRPFLRHLYLRHRYNAKVNQELVPYIDCFLENMYRYKYIAVIDIDEVILPAKASNYSSLFSELEKPNLTTSFCFEMKLFADKIKFQNGSVIADARVLHPDFIDDPNIPYIAKKVYYDKVPICTHKRTRNVKCFHNTESVLLVHHHSSIKCLEGKTNCSQRASMEIGYTHHHKESFAPCYLKATDPPQLRQDPFGYDGNIKRFFDTKVISRIDSILQKLDI